VEVAQRVTQLRQGCRMSGTTEDRVVRLATASNPQEAALWQQALEAEGIRCRVVRGDARFVRRRVPRLCAARNLGV
jgi:hypothetical protein